MYSSEYGNPRLGAGSFIVALRAVYKKLTGNELQYTLYGKPSEMTYIYAENLIRDLTKENIRQFYGIGDYPRSDIRGTNSRDNWSSVLVKTGVFPSDLDNDPVDPADFVVNDVLDAVNLIIEREKKKASE